MAGAVIDIQPLIPFCSLSLTCKLLAGQNCVLTAFFFFLFIQVCSPVLCSVHSVNLGE